MTRNLPLLLIAAALLAQAPPAGVPPIGGNRVFPGQLLPCPVPPGAPGAFLITLPTNRNACAAIGSGFVLSTDAVGNVTINPAASTSVMQTVGVTTTATTPNSFPLPAGATHLTSVFRNLKELPCVVTAPNVCTPPPNAGYTFTSGIVVFTDPLQIGETIIIEGW